MILLVILCVLVVVLVWELRKADEYEVLTMLNQEDMLALPKDLFPRSVVRRLVKKGWVIELGDYIRLTLKGQRQL